MNTFEALYTSTCTHCEELIRPGQLAGYNELDEVVHVSCPAPTDDDPTKACKTCHLIHPPGDCE